MQVEGIERGGPDPSGPVNKYSKKPWALFIFDVEGANSANINGNPLVPIQDNAIKRPYADDKTYDAYAVAWDNRNATSITLHHPDFYNCKINFADYLGREPIKGGEVYKIKLKIPSATLLEATKAYHNLDFEEARKFFSTIAEDPVSQKEEKEIARVRLADMDSVILWKRKATEYEHTATTTTGRQHDRALYLARLFYNKIFRATGLVNAGIRIKGINDALFGKSEASDSELSDDNAGFNSHTHLTISSSEESNDYRAFGNDAVPYQYTDKHKHLHSAKSSLIIITSPFKDLIVDSPYATAPIKSEDGEIWLYTHAFGAEDEIPSNETIFSVTPPSYTRYGTTNVSLENLGLTALEAERVYRVSIDKQTLVMELANEQLTNLDFDNARHLFSNNFENAEEAASARNCLTFLNDARVVNAIQQIDSYAATYRKLDLEWLKIIAGERKFASLPERNKELADINSKISAHASTLASSYKTIVERAKKAGLRLKLAEDYLEEYSKALEGAHNMPLIIIFSEAGKEGDNKYVLSDELSYQPSVRLEFRGKDKKKIPYSANLRTDQKVEKVKDNQLHLTLNRRVSDLFLKGEGKLKIIPLEPKGNDSADHKTKKYKSAEYDISEFKVDDYGIIKIKVLLYN